MKRIILALVCAVLIVSFALVFYFREQNAVKLITNYSQCEENGFEVSGESPKKCKTPDGREFFEELQVPTPDVTDMVVVFPEQGDRVSSPVEVIGKAKGNWFFEATFPVTVLDDNQNEIGYGFVESLGEWMTEDFVDFKGEITFNSAGHDGGEIVFKNSNPSGMPEFEKSVSVKVKFAASNAAPAPSDAATSTAPTATPQCIKTGCSGQICSDHDVMSTCEYADFYACYQNAECTVQDDGQCGWTQTSSLQQCITGSTSVNDTLY
jgi:eight-cysteine-cluster-containing protein